MEEKIKERVKAKEREQLPASLSCSRSPPACPGPSRLGWVRVIVEASAI